MNRQQLRKKVDDAWAQLEDAYDGLSDAKMTEPGVTGNWSVRDILAHVSVWEEEALKHLPLIIAGGTPPRYSVKYGGIDAFNALMMEQRKDEALSDILSQSSETHRRLVAYIESVPEEQFMRDSRFRRRLRLDTYSHYLIHAQTIHDWRERSGG